MGYENDPITGMLASSCIVCGRALRAAESVEGCMGPHCAKKHGFFLDKPEAEVKEAAKLLREMAFEADAEMVLVKLTFLYVMGWHQLAKQIARNFADIRLTQEIQLGGPAYIRVEAPYKPEATAGWRSIPGRRWDKEAKVNKVPCGSRAALEAFLAQHYPGQLGWDDEKGTSFKVDGAGKRLRALKPRTAAPPADAPAPSAAPELAQPAPVPTPEMGAFLALGKRLEAAGVHDLYQGKSKEDGVCALSGLPLKGANVVTFQGARCRTKAVLDHLDTWQVG